ncbi:MAG: DUF2207 family protein [Ilumatobacteraceae bacterium]
MAELGGLSVWRHGIVGAAVAGGAVLAGAGVIGADAREERFESKQVVVTPAGDDGVRITEVVDIDFGDAERRGYQRVVPNDFGEPTNVTAFSSDAPDDVDVSPLGFETRIRIGDPDITNTGQHRYELAYTLPEAQLDSGQLAVDIISPGEELATERFEIVVDGFRLDDPQCNVGALGAEGGCELREVADGTYRAEITPLEAGDGITIGGTIVEVTEPIDVAAPPLPERIIEDSRLPLAVSMVPLGLASGGAVYLWSRRRGRNEVFAGGAADAAYGTPTPAPRLDAGATLPPPTLGVAPVATADERPVRLVADERLADLATTEFVPPTGIHPWQGAVLVGERIDEGVVGAWFSGLAARDVVTIERNEDDDVVLGRGPRYDTAAADERAVLDPLFSGRDDVILNSYDKDFATAWRDVRTMQGRAIAASGWWKQDPPRAGGSSGRSWLVFVVLGVWIAIAAGSVLSAVLGVLSSPIAAIAFGIVVPAAVGLAAYQSLRPARSATGSALALRTESFRRFLVASEGRHVEWAWSKGLLREYSAWAVALGAASAWKRALSASSVPPTEYVSGPLLLYTMGPSFASAHTPPSSGS